MKADRKTLDRALDKPSGDIRLYLFYGPDEAGSAALAARIEKAMGGQAERVDLTLDTLRSDPARLADEAASISMFGDTRWIRLLGVGDESLPAVEALLQAERAGNPVVAVTGALKPTSRLLKLANDHPHALACISYVPDEKDAARLAIGIARERGLGLAPDLAHRIATLCANDRALIAGEIEKIALYLDASPAQPRDATAEALHALSAEAVDGDISPLVNAVLGGAVDVMQQELDALDSRGAALASAMRPMMTRAMLIAGLRADADRTGSISGAVEARGKAIFFREKDAIKAQVRRWPAPAIARAIERLALAEQATRGSGGDLVARHHLLAIARQAARER